MATIAVASNIRRQLGPKDWIDAAVSVMVASSVEQVRVEQLATGLGVSKGSFYHHFRDRNELLLGVLEQWKNRATLAVQARLDRAEPLPDRRLLLFMQLPFHSEPALRAADLELAILGWARRSPEARAAVEKVDQLRTKNMAGLFAACGFDAAEAVFRAHQAYALLRYAAQRRDLAPAERQDLVVKVHAALISR